MYRPIISKQGEQVDAGLSLLRLAPASAADAAALQAVLEAAPQFSLLAEGHLPDPDAGQQELLALPPGKQLEDKYMLLLCQQGKAIGACDLVRAYPTPDTAFLGLLLVIETEQGRGHGPQAMELLQAMAQSWGCQKMRLAVLEANLAGQRFWHKQGFVEIGRKPSAQYLSGLIVMEKSLTQADDTCN